MPENNIIFAVVRWLRIRIPTLFAQALGIDSERKTVLFLDLSRAATLRDLVYWLQIIFAAGIATLGLVLNSPAVIIGAMLISPLMNPILASGLALASGDLVLGIRAAFNLILSCLVAIIFAVILVVVLPFREITAEITARTQPNVLDLVIALFSGAVGSVAISREVKGVVTSIPGVAIAVALMPPLCVVGYGIGLVLVFDVETGWRVATGGGLLFLTNLVAITFTAMMVFLALRIDPPEVREKVEEWEQTDAESSFVIRLMERFPGLEKARKIHSLSLRLVMILIPLIVILIPLNSSFRQLQNEIVQKRRESEIRKIVTDVWQEKFQRKSDGVSRSSVDNLTISEIDGKLNINLRVFDDEPYTLDEKKNCAQLIAAQLDRQIETINLKLTEIPTVSVLDAIEQARQKQSPPPLTISELQENLLEQVEIALSDFKLPPPMSILRKQIVTDPSNTLELKIIYLGDEPISEESKNALLLKIRQNLDIENVALNLERVPVQIGEINFDRNKSELTLLTMLQLDFAGRMMKENPKLAVLVKSLPAKNEKADIANERWKAILNYLETRWQISSNKVVQGGDATITGKTFLEFKTIEIQPKSTAD